MKILVKRTGSVGDVIMSTVIVRQLISKNNKHDSVSITVQTQCPEVFTAMLYHREVAAVVQEANPNDFDVFINLDDAYESSERGHFLDHMFMRAQLAPLTYDCPFDAIPRLSRTREDKKHVDLFIEENELDKFVVFHMRNWHWAAKNFPKTFWLELMQEIYSVRSDFKVVAVGSPHDFTLDVPGLVVDARGKMSLQQLQYLIDQTEVFVGTDSAPYHLAAGAKAVLLSTHLKPSRIMYDGHANVIAEIPCMGCYDRQPKPVRSINCDTNDYRCVTKVPVKVVAQEVLSQLTTD